MQRQFGTGPQVSRGRNEPLPRGSVPALADASSIRRPLDRDDFGSKVSDLQAAAAAFLVAATPGDDAAIGEAASALNGACRGCHMNYRARAGGRR